MVQTFYYPSKIWKFLNSETYPTPTVLYKGLWTWSIFFQFLIQNIQNTNNTENFIEENILACFPPSTAHYLVDQEAQQP